MKSRLRNLLLVWLVLACSAAPASAVEQILAYDSLIEIATDGSSTVTETIAVNAEEKKIKRGIYRDFPTTYEGRWGTRVVVPFDVIAVERDGHSEPYHTEKIDGGVRVYLGNANQKVSRGLTSSLGSSLAGTVASTSTAPGSSSGGGGGGSSGGGGGSSGGGGGGGGGGGW